MIWQNIGEGAIIEHNPRKSPKTGDWRYMKPKVDKKDCAGCGQCVPYCPEGAISFDSEGKAEIDYDICKGCGVCAAVCPRKAIRMMENV